MSDLEERLRNELGRRAEVEAASVTLAEVRERAARLRRRARVGAVAGVAAAVLLVVLPVAVLATRSPDDAPPQPAPGGPTPSGSPTVGPTDLPPDRVTVREWVAGLPAGPAPRIAYQVGLDLVPPNGAERRSAYPDPLWAFVQYQGGLVGTDLPFGAQSDVVLDDSLRRVDGGCTAGAPAPSADRTRVYWSTGACQERAADGLGSIFTGTVDGTQPPLAEEIIRSEGMAIRVLGPVTGGNGSGGPIAYVLVGAGGSGPVSGVWTTDLAGSFAQVPGLSEGLAASTTGLVAGGNGRWTVVLDVETQQVLWRERLNASIGDFSPDGRLLLLDDTVRRALTGEVLTQLDPVAPLTSPVWEDDQHLLVAVRGSGGEAAVVRYDLDGDAEVAARWFDASTGGTSPTVGFEVVP